MNENDLQSSPTFSWHLYALACHLDLTCGAHKTMEAPDGTMEWDRCQLEQTVQRWAGTFEYKYAS